MREGKNRQSLLLPILLPAGLLVVIALVLFGFSRVLLAVSHNAATVVALIVAVAIVSVAGSVASRQRVTGSTLFSMVAAVVGVAMVAGGLAVVAAPLEEEGGEEPGGEGVVLALAAPEGAAVDGFSTDALSAHADRDDGSEWSTYYLRTWLLDRQLFPFEDGVRRLTHLPAMVTGLRARGLLARGYHADVMMFDPSRLALGKKQLVRDMPGGEERWQVLPEGVVRVLVNGETIVEDGRLTGTRAGRVLRVGNPA